MILAATDAPAATTLYWIDLAMKSGELPGARHAFLKGLRMLVKHEFTAAAAFFETQVETYGDDRDVLYGLAEARKLPGRKLGSAWRFSRAALVAWLSTPEGR